MSMLGKKKGQGLSMNVIVIAVIALIVLVVIVAMLVGKLGIFSKGTDDVLASGTQGFDLDDEDGVSVRSERFSPEDVSVTVEKAIPSDTISGTVKVIANEQLYKKVETLIYKLIDSDQPSKGAPPDFIYNNLISLETSSDENGMFPYSKSGLTDAKYIVLALVTTDTDEKIWSDYQIDCSSSLKAKYDRDCVVDRGSIQDFTITIPAGETSEGITPIPQPSPATSPDCDTDEDTCLDNDKCPDQTPGDEGKGFGEELFVGVNIFGTPKCSGDDKGEWYLANRYTLSAIEEEEYLTMDISVSPASKKASCRRRIDCVTPFDPPICHPPAPHTPVFDTRGWACSDNLWDLCDSDDKCDTVKIGEKLYYCDGVNTWGEIKPEGCEKLSLPAETQVEISPTGPIEINPWAGEDLECSTPTPTINPAVMECLPESGRSCADGFSCIISKDKCKCRS